MAYTNPTKAIELARELADKFRIRFSGKTITEGFDTDGNPTIAIDDGTAAAGEQNFFIKIRPVDWPLAKDVLGNSANIYVPSVVQLATETSGTANVTLVTVANLLACLGELVLRGTKIEWYLSANGVRPTAATITGNPAASFYPDLYNPLTNQQ